MAKTARRSVASDPSSPHSKSHYRTTNDDPTSSAGHHHQPPSTPGHSPYSTQKPSAPRPSNIFSYSQTSNNLYSQNASADHHPQHRVVHNSSNHFANHNGSASRPTPVLPPAFNGTRILDRVAAERERVRVEFFATYDVMTGVRIAATLGGFFGLMVFLVVYKSRGESQETIKALKDPKIAAVAAAVMQEEEDRELQEAMDATGMSIYPDDYDHIGYRRGRLMSVGNISAPPVFNRGYRFSSIGGGYSSLLRPSAAVRRYSCSESGGKPDGSSPASARVLAAYPMGGSFGIDDYFLETDGDEADDEYDQATANSLDVERHRSGLSVPQKGQESRRSSNITCCSTESSYLERRCSAMTLGLSSLPSARSSSRRQSSSETWDYYYPGIQVIQPTPHTSPCPSERCTTDKPLSTAPTEGKTKPSAAQLKFRAKSLSIEQQHQDSIDTISLYSSDDKLPTATVTSHIHSAADLMSSTGSADNVTPSTLSYSHLSAQRLVHNRTSHSQPNIIRRAPLASLSSFKISSMDYQDSDLKSLGSDSVFAESYADTDDEMDQFSLDSDETGSSNAQSPPNTRSYGQHQSQTSSGKLRRKSIMSMKPTSAISRGSTLDSASSSTSRPSTKKDLTNICSIVNECETKPRRGRRMLQRSSTIYPSSESLTKCQQNLPNVHTPATNTFETMATIERASPSAISTGSSSTASAFSSASVIQHHLYSAPPSTGKPNTSPSAPTPVRPSRSTNTRPASYAGSTGYNPPRLSNLFSISQRSNNIPMGDLALVATRSPIPHVDGQSKFEAEDFAAAIIASASEQTPPPNPSVIIELPVISVATPPTGNDDDTENNTSCSDPSLPPGTIRKWSKETLF